MSEALGKNNLSEPTVDKESRNKKNGNGLRMLGIIIVCFSLFIIFVPLVHTLRTGFKAQYSPVFVIGFIILTLGVGLTLRYFWAWICSGIFFSLLILNNIINYIRTQQDASISNIFILIVLLAVLNKTRDQVVRNRTIKP